LFTLIALQGNVSSKNQSVMDTRGNGSVELIEFFQRMYAECSGTSTGGAEMIVVSGQTSIRFDGTYKMAANAAGVKIIAFNAANDLTQAPDAKYVKQLAGSSRFPGTLIAIKFPLSTVSSTVASQEIES
jgi:hypothetical protein